MIRTLVFLKMEVIWANIIKWMMGKNAHILLSLLDATMNAGLNSWPFVLHWTTLPIELINGLTSLSWLSGAQDEFKQAQAWTMLNHTSKSFNG